MACDQGAGRSRSEFLDSSTPQPEVFVIAQVQTVSSHPKQMDDLFAAVAERAWCEEQQRVEIPENPGVAAHFAYGVPMHSRGRYHALYGIVRPCPELVSLSPQLSFHRVLVRNAQEMREFDETLAAASPSTTCPSMSSSPCTEATRVVQEALIRVALGF